VRARSQGLPARMRCTGSKVVSNLRANRHPLRSNFLPAFTPRTSRASRRMKQISWNRRAVEQAKAQGLEDVAEVVRPKSETKPALKQFGRRWCECGELEGFVMEG
jgi:hypothetical protein